MATYTLSSVEKIDQVVQALISEALERARKESVRARKEYEKGVVQEESGAPERLAGHDLDTVLRAIGTHRPVSWRHAYSLVHRIVELEAELDELRQKCLEKIAGAPPDEGRID